MTKCVRFCSSCLLPGPSLLKTMDNLESFNSKVSKIEQSKEILEKKLNDLEDEIYLKLFNLSTIFLTTMKTI